MSSAAAVSKPFIRPVAPGDALRLAQTLRKVDREEVWHSSRKDPFAAILPGYMAEDKWAIEKSGRLVALFGVVGVKGEYGCPWMLGTNELSRCRSLLRECRARLDVYTQEYRYLTNAVWSKNEVHIAWITWLGFQFEGSDIRHGETFLHFHRSTNV